MTEFRGGARFRCGHHLHRPSACTTAYVSAHLVRDDGVRLVVVAFTLAPTTIVSSRVRLSCRLRSRPRLCLAFARPCVRVLGFLSSSTRSWGTIRRRRISSFSLDWHDGQRRRHFRRFRRRILHEDHGDYLGALT